MTEERLKELENTFITRFSDWDKNKKMNIINGVRAKSVFQWFVENFKEDETRRKCYYTICNNDREKNSIFCSRHSEFY